MTDTTEITEEHIEPSTEAAEQPAEQQPDGQPAAATGPEEESSSSGQDPALSYYRIRFRPGDQPFTAAARIDNLRTGEAVMVQTDHGPEPALVHSRAERWPGEEGRDQSYTYTIQRRCSREEGTRFANLADLEERAHGICRQKIEKLGLPMKLIRVERFFNGSKIIFYFTAESRVDFRELVKNLVQEFRTRVEMRQIGVRHETKMLGGLGCCGRELCCSSFIKEFDSVSIKMAKEQNLPLNPAKISGACNRLLCCLNYEFATYKALRKNMPKVGKRIVYKEQICKVRRHNALNQTIVVADPDNKEITLNREEWLQTTPVLPPPKKKG